MNIVCYNTILPALCRVGMLEAALQFMEKKLVEGRKPDAITFNIII